MHLEMFCNRAQLLGIREQLVQTARKILTAHIERNILEKAVLSLKKYFLSSC